MRILLTATLYLLIATIVPNLCSSTPAGTPEKSWVGIYRSETYVNNKRYKSLVEISLIGEGVLHIDGHCQGRPVLGVAQLIGDNLVIGWLQESGPGITVLKKQRSGITGQWASRPGDGELREEKWILIPEKNLKVD